jgi:hypothetical protein
MRGAFTASLIAALLYGIGTSQSQPSNQPSNCAPGSCWNPYINLVGGIGSSSTNFAVIPSFDVNSTGGFLEVGFGAMRPVSGDLSLGWRASLLGTHLTGTTFYQPSGFTYTVRQNGAVMGEIVLRKDLRLPWNESHAPVTRLAPA